MGIQGRKNKTKEQLSKETENRQEVARKREIVVNKFYPALIKATVSVDEAKMLIQAMSTLLMEEVLKTMQERKFTEIIDQLHNKLAGDNERRDEVQGLLDTLIGENLYTAREIIEGMTRAINQMVNDELKDRRLESLKPDWERYLN